MTDLVTAPKRTRRRYFSPGSISNRVIAALPPKNRQILVINPGKWQQTLVSEEVELHEMWTKKIQDLTNKLVKDPDLSTDKTLEDRLKYSSFCRQFIEDMSRIRHEVAATKITNIVDQVQNLLDQGCDKLVVATRHDEVAHALKKVFPNAALSDMGTDAAQRKMESERFQNDRQCQLYVQRIKSIGEDRALTMASHVLFAEQEWEHGAINYAEDRCLGNRDHGSLTIQILVFADSLDERKCRTLDPGTTSFIQLPQ